MPCRNADHLGVNRRTVLVAGGLGFCGLDLQRLTAATAQPAAPRKIAKSTILIFLQGGASHIDTWDMKPAAPAEYRGEFSPIETSAPGLVLCEHLPLTSRQARHVSVVKSVGDNGLGLAAHQGGHYHVLTGHAPDRSFATMGDNRGPLPDDWPFIGSVVAYKRPRHPYLPQNVWLPQKAVESGYVRPGQFSARLGVEWDPLYLEASLDQPLDFRVPALTLSGDVNVQRLEHRRELLETFDNSQRKLEQSNGLSRLSKHQEQAFTLLCSQQSKAAFDILREPESMRDKYGPTINGTSFLMARRLVEAAVPFVTVWWRDDIKAHNEMKCLSAGNWDTHGNNFGCLKNRLLPDFDRAYAALLEDLHDRGLLDETLVVVMGEMGRQPKIGDPRSGGAGGTNGAGRDHWTQCMSVLFAGGGIRGGQVYGSSDKRAEYPAEKPVAPEHIAKTIYHAMGIDNLEAVTPDGRPYNLLEEGFPLTELF